MEITGQTNNEHAWRLFRANASMRYCRSVRVRNVSALGEPAEQALKAEGLLHTFDAIYERFMEDAYEPDDEHDAFQAMLENKYIELWEGLYIYEHEVFALADIVFDMSQDFITGVMKRDPVPPDEIKNVLKTYISRNKLRADIVIPTKREPNRRLI